MNLKYGFALLSLACWPMFAQEVVVSGSATIKKAPEIAKLYLTLQGRSGSNEDARGKVDIALYELKAAAAGIPNITVTVRNYASGEDVERADSGKISRKGYAAAAELEISIDNLASLGKALLLGDVKGVSALTGLQFDIRDRKKAEREAFVAAREDAMMKANDQASSMGKKNVELKRMQEKGVYFSDPFSVNVDAGPYGLPSGLLEPQAMQLDSGKGRRSSEEKALFVTPGTIDVSANVVILVEIK